MDTQRTFFTKLYIGIDIHKRNLKIHRATDLFSGKSLTMSPNPEDLKTYLAKLILQNNLSARLKIGPHIFSK